MWKLALQINNTVNVVFMLVIGKGIYCLKAV